jgi:hypothetical protein
MDYFAELWAAAKQAGPFASLFALTAIVWLLQERKRLQTKYDELEERFLTLAADDQQTDRELKEMITKILGAVERGSR